MSTRPRDHHERRGEAPEQRPKPSRGVWASFVGAMAMMALFVGLRLRVTSDITHFLPSGRDHALGALSRQLADSPVTRTLVLCLSGADPDTLAAAAAAMAQELVAAPEIASVQRGPTPDLAEAVYRLYGPRAAGFLSERPEEDLPAALRDEGLSEAVGALKRALASPVGPLVARLAPQDPLQWFGVVLKRMERAQAGTLLVEGAQFFTRDRASAILFVAGKHSPFEGAASERLLGAVDAAFARANAAAGGKLRLARAGVAPVARDAEARMRRDLTRISIASLAGVIALFFLFLGGARGLVLALAPLLAGALTALATGLLLFGRLHALTLAIGSSLVGVALDYPILFLTHRAGSPDERSRTVARRVGMGIFMGGLTTAAGFLALGWSSFPGVRELALTSAAGILAALAVTRWALPEVSERPLRAPWLAKAARLGQRLMSRPSQPRARWLGAATVALALGVAAVGIPRVRWADSLEALNAADPALKAEADGVRARVSGIEEGRLVVVDGADMEEALARNDVVAARLGATEVAGALAGSVSLHSFLWSRALQERNLRQVWAAPSLASRAVAALAKQGFREAMFAPFIARLSAPAPQPLGFEELASSPLSPLVRPFLVPLGERVGLLTFLRGVRDPAAVRAALADLPGVRYFDQRAFLDETYARFRVQTLQALGLGLAVIAAVLYGRYRNLRTGIAALAPAVLAAGATLGLFGLAGMSCHLLHALSLLLVLSMGVDYGVFFVESRGPGAAGLTLVSAATACLTTLFSFGLLALSATPALRAIGLTVGIGIVLSLLLAPVTLTLTRR